MKYFLDVAVVLLLMLPSLTGKRVLFINKPTVISCTKNECEMTAQEGEKIEVVIHCYKCDDNLSMEISQDYDGEIECNCGDSTKIKITFK